MKKIGSFLTCMIFILSCSTPQQKEQLEGDSIIQENWKTELDQKLKVFGHRNWIVIVDAAYPEQSNPAIKTITIDDNQLEAVEFVSTLIEKSNHVDANIFVDKEMAFVAEENAKGIEAYRTDLHQILSGKNTKAKLHEDIIKELDSAAKLFNVLIIKTSLAIPYTSVFFQLDCGYWNTEAEEKLRNEMNKK